MEASDVADDDAAFNKYMHERNETRAAIRDRIRGARTATMAADDRVHVANSGARAYSNLRFPGGASDAGNPIHPKETWVATVVTGTLDGSGSSARICMDVCGDRGSVRGIVINESKHHLTHGSTTSVEFDADRQQLGNLQKIRVHVEVSSDNGRTAWFLDSVTLVHKSGAKVRRSEHGSTESYSFMHQQWFTYDRPVQEIAASGQFVDRALNPTSVKYVVKVFTSMSTEQRAPQRGGVVATLFGAPHHDTGARYLRSTSTQPAKFKRGTVASFDMEAISLGPLQRIRLALGNPYAIASSHKTPNEDCRWHVEKVVVFDPSLPGDVVFTCGKWLGKAHPDGVLEVELTAGNTVPTCGYEIVTRTSKKMLPSGISGPAWPTVVVHGKRPASFSSSSSKNGATEGVPVAADFDTEPFVLQPGDDRPHFGPGRQDTFTFENGVCLEHITSVTVSFAGASTGSAGTLSAWNVASIRVTAREAGKALASALFKCAGVAIGGAGNGQTTRTFTRDESPAQHIPAPTPPPTRRSGTITATGLWVATTLADNGHAPRPRTGTVTRRDGTRGIDCWNRDYKPSRPTQAKVKSSATVREQSLSVLLKRAADGASFGAVFTVQPDGRLHVDDVTPNTPAATHLARGDVIESINGTDAARLTSADVAKILRDADRLALRMTRLTRHTVHSLAVETGTHSLFDQQQPQRNGSQKQGTATFRDANTIERAKRKQQLQKSMDTAKSLMTLLPVTRRRQYVAPAGTKSEDTIDHYLRAIGKTGREQLAACVKSSQKKDSRRAWESAAAKSKVGGRADVTLAHELWSIVRDVLHAKTQTVDGVSLDEYKRRLEPAQSDMAAATARSDAARSAKAAADAALCEAEARLKTAQQATDTTFTGDGSSVQNALVRVSDSRASALSAAETLSAAQAETDRCTAAVETIVGNIRRSRTLARQQRSVDAHNAALTPWRASHHTPAPTPRHRTATATAAVPNATPTTTSAPSHRSPITRAARKTLARTILHVVRECGADITSPEQVWQALQRHDHTEAGQDAVTVEEIEAVLARELRDEAATQAKRKERNATAFAAWHQSKQGALGVSTRSLGRVLDSMRMEEQHRGHCAGDTTHYCPVPLGGTRTGGYVVHVKGEHPDASPAEQHPTAPAVGRCCPAHAICIRMYLCCCWEHACTLVLPARVCTHQARR
eukprot:m.1583640 g.1583640  ORF g.1583640 m.1583640 type:complete len:1184 (+) comp25320_c0_seq19:352-3903(+)